MLLAGKAAAEAVVFSDWFEASGRALAAEFPGRVNSARSNKQEDCMRLNNARLTRVFAYAALYWTEQFNGLTGRSHPS